MMWFKRMFLIFIYIIAINLFGLLIRFLNYADFLLQSNEQVDTASGEYDYIVVGSGSAGSLIAKRLAEEKNTKILVLEAGSHRHGFLDIPSLGLLLQNTHFSWQYKTETQRNACFGLNNHKSFWPFGRIVGGTAMLNNMIYVRGHPEDFEDWFKSKYGYNFSRDIEPYFKRVENVYVKGDGKKSKFFTSPPFSSRLPSHILSAAKSLNFPILDSTVHCDKGFGEPKVNQRNGKRWTTSHSISNGQYENINLQTNREVQEILFHNNFEAYGVKYKHLDHFYTATAKKGVILAAGVIGSPKILLHSGIGPGWHLEELNIPVRFDLQVGENLQDHLTTGFDLILLNQTLGMGIDHMFSPFAVLEYFLKGTGPWTTEGCEVLGFFTSKHSKNLRPDVQLMAMPIGLTDDDGIYLRHIFNIKENLWNNYFALLNRTATMTILPVLLHPKSRGTVRLKSADFDTDLRIDPNYLSHKDDVKILISGIRMIQKIVETESMQKIGARLNSNIIPGCEHLKFDTDSYWECYVRQLSITSYHAVGTCMMGADEDSSSVVNYDFQVKGTNKLYVVDGSVVPSLPSGNVNGAILMLVEMASDSLKLRDYSSRGKCDSWDIFFTKDFC